jgi:hypothetical protein
LGFSGSIEDQHLQESERQDMTFIKKAIKGILRARKIIIWRWN